MSWRFAILSASDVTYSIYCVDCNNNIEASDMDEELMDVLFWGYDVSLVNAFSMYRTDCTVLCTIPR